MKPALVAQIVRLVGFAAIGIGLTVVARANLVPSVLVGVAITLIGAALVTLEASVTKHLFPSEWFALAAALLAYLLLLASLYEVPVMQAPDSPAFVHVLTALLLLTVGIGIMLARPHRGLMSIVASSAAGGVMARRLLLPALVLPPFLGWLTGAQPWITTHDASLSRALWVWSLVIIFTVLIWKSASVLNRVAAERAEGEVVARQGQAFIQAIVDNSPAVISAKTPEGRYLLVNRRYRELMGAAADDIVGKTDFDIFDHHHALAYRALDARAAASSTPIVEEEVLKQPEGLRHFLTIKSRLIDSSGDVYAVFGVATDITDRKNAESERLSLLERERKAREEAEALLGMARKLASELDIEKVVQHVTDTATRLIGAQIGAFFRSALNESGEALLLFTLSGAPRESFERFGTPRNTALFDPIFRGQGPVRLADVTQDARYGQNPPHKGMPTGHLPVRSYLAVPVTSRSGKVLGGLFFGHEDADVFDERAERLVVGIAAQAAVAVDNATLYLRQEESSRRLTNQLNQLRLLAQVTRSIEQHQQLGDIFDVVIKALEEQLPSDFSCLCLYSTTAADFHCTHVGAKGRAISPRTGILDGAKLDIEEDFLKLALQGELVNVPDLSQAHALLGRSLCAGGLSCLLAAPLKIENRVLGVIIVARATPCGFDQTDTDFLRQLCDHIALVMQHSELYSNLRQAYDELRASQQTILQQERLRSLGQLASGIAHDINNAISPATVYIDSILEHDATLGSRTREHLVTVQRAIGDVAETVSRMRAFYRPSQSELELRPVDLRVAIEEVLELTRPRWSDMPQQDGAVVAVEIDIAKDLPRVLGSETEIRDGLTNLIFNAVDAMPRGGTLSIQAYQRMRGEDSQPELVVEVADTGVGMDAATRDRCLEPFFSTKGERGTGLGLPMVYGMTQRHGAELEIDTAPDRGTSMRIVFPARLTSTNDGPTHRRKAPAAARPVRVLLIDDDPSILASLSDTLSSEGHEVEVALGGQSGIDQFRARHATAKQYEAVITDLGMPHVDGRKVALEIRGISPGTPIILLTGWGQRLRDEGDIPEGVSRVLAKPARLQDLRSALDELVPERNAVCVS